MGVGNVGPEKYVMPQWMSDLADTSKVKQKPATDTAKAVAPSVQSGPFYVPQISPNLTKLEKVYEYIKAFKENGTVDIYGLEKLEKFNKVLCSLILELQKNDSLSLDHPDIKKLNEIFKYIKETYIPAAYENNKDVLVNKPISSVCMHLYMGGGSPYDYRSNDYGIPSYGVTLVGNAIKFLADASNLLADLNYREAMNGSSKSSEFLKKAEAYIQQSKDLISFNKTTHFPNKTDANYRKCFESVAGTEIRRWNGSRIVNETYVPTTKFDFSFVSKNENDVQEFLDCVVLAPVLGPGYYEDGYQYVVLGRDLLSERISLANARNYFNDIAIADDKKMYESIESIEFKDVSQYEILKDVKRWIESDKLKTVYSFLKSNNLDENKAIDAFVSIAKQLNVDLIPALNFEEKRLLLLEAVTQKIKGFIKKVNPRMVDALNFIKVNADLALFMLKFVEKNEGDNAKIYLMSFPGFSLTDNETVNIEYSEVTVDEVIGALEYSLARPDFVFGYVEYLLLDKDNNYSIIDSVVDEALLKIDFSKSTYDKKMKFLLQISKFRAIAGTMGFNEDDLKEILSLQKSLGSAGLKPEDKVALQSEILLMLVNYHLKNKDLSKAGKLLGLEGPKTNLPDGIEAYISYKLAVVTYYFELCAENKMQKQEVISALENGKYLQDTPTVKDDKAVKFYLQFAKLKLSYLKDELTNKVLDGTEANVGEYKNLSDLAYDDESHYNLNLFLANYYLEQVIDFEDKPNLDAVERSLKAVPESFKDKIDYKLTDIRYSLKRKGKTESENKIGAITYDQLATEQHKISYNLAQMELANLQEVDFKSGLVYSLLGSKDGKEKGLALATKDKITVKALQAVNLLNRQKTKDDEFNIQFNEFLNEAEKLLSGIDDKIDKVKIQSNIELLKGIAYFQQRTYGEAAKYFAKAISGLQSLIDFQKTAEGNKTEAEYINTLKVFLATHVRANRVLGSELRLSEIDLNKYLPESFIANNNNLQEAKDDLQLDLLFATRKYDEISGYTLFANASEKIKQKLQILQVFSLLYKERGKPFIIEAGAEIAKLEKETMQGIDNRILFLSLRQEIQYFVNSVKTSEEAKDLMIRLNQEIEEFKANEDDLRPHHIAQIVEIYRNYLIKTGQGIKQFDSLIGNPAKLSGNPSFIEVLASKADSSEFTFKDQYVDLETFKTGFGAEANKYLRENKLTSADSVMFVVSDEDDIHIVFQKINVLRQAQMLDKAQLLVEQAIGTKRFKNNPELFRTQINVLIDKLQLKELKDATRAADVKKIEDLIAKYAKNGTSYEDKVETLFLQMALANATRSPMYDKDGQIKAEFARPNNQQEFEKGRKKNSYEFSYQMMLAYNQLSSKNAYSTSDYNKIRAKLEEVYSKGLSLVEQVEFAEARNGVLIRILEHTKGDYEKAGLTQKEVTPMSWDQAASFLAATDKSSALKVAGQLSDTSDDSYMRIKATLKGYKSSGGDDEEKADFTKDLLFIEDGFGNTGLTPTYPGVSDEINGIKPNSRGRRDLSYEDDDFFGARLKVTSANNHITGSPYAEDGKISLNQIHELRSERLKNSKTGYYEYSGDYTIDGEPVENETSGGNTTVGGGTGTWHETDSDVWLTDHTGERTKTFGADPTNNALLRKDEIGLDLFDDSLSLSFTQEKAASDQTLGDFSEPDYFMDKQDFGVKYRKNIDYTGTGFELGYDVINDNGTLSRIGGDNIYSPSGASGGVMDENFLTMTNAEYDKWLKETHSLVLTDQSPVTQKLSTYISQQFGEDYEINFYGQYDDTKQHYAKLSAVVKNKMLADKFMVYVFDSESEFINRFNEKETVQQQGIGAEWYKKIDKFTLFCKAQVTQSFKQDGSEDKAISTSAGTAVKVGAEYQLDEQTVIGGTAGVFAPDTDYKGASKIVSYSAYLQRRDNIQEVIESLIYEKKIAPIEGIKIPTEALENEKALFAYTDSLANQGKYEEAFNIRKSYLEQKLTKYENSWVDGVSKADVAELRGYLDKVKEYVNNIYSKDSAARIQYEAISSIQPMYQSFFSKVNLDIALTYVATQINQLITDKQVEITDITKLFAGANLDFNSIKLAGFEIDAKLGFVIADLISDPRTLLNLGIEAKQDFQLMDNLRLKVAVELSIWDPHLNFGLALESWKNNLQINVGVQTGFNLYNKTNSKVKFGGIQTDFSQAMLANPNIAVTLGGAEGSALHGGSYSVLYFGLLKGIWLRRESNPGEQFERDNEIGSFYKGNFQMLVTDASSHHAAFLRQIGEQMSTLQGMSVIYNSEKQKDIFAEKSETALLLAHYILGIEEINGKLSKSYLSYGGYTKIKDNTICLDVEELRRFAEKHNINLDITGTEVVLDDKQQEALAAFVQEKLLSKIKDEDSLDIVGREEIVSIIRGVTFKKLGFQSDEEETVSILVEDIASKINDLNKLGVQIKIKESVLADLVEDKYRLKGLQRVLTLVLEKGDEIKDIVLEINDSGMPILGFFADNQVDDFTAKVSLRKLRDIGDGESEDKYYLVKKLVGIKEKDIEIFAKLAFNQKLDEFLKKYPNKYSYNKRSGELAVTGKVTKDEYDELKNIWTEEKDRTALANLEKSSQTSHKDTSNRTAELIFDMLKDKKILVEDKITGQYYFKENGDINWDEISLVYKGIDYNGIKESIKKLCNNEATKNEVENAWADDSVVQEFASELNEIGTLNTNVAKLISSLAKIRIDCNFTYDEEKDQYEFQMISRDNTAQQRTFVCKNGLLYVKKGDVVETEPFKIDENDSFHRALSLIFMGGGKVSGAFFMIMQREIAKNKNAENAKVSQSIDSTNEALLVKSREALELKERNLQLTTELAAATSALTEAYSKFADLESKIIIDAEELIIVKENIAVQKKT
ncbi:MAG: hypothetical protein PHF25_05365, partial [Candidatus Margulisbacteria bacterium]|nr:hypothetical protein [Candidatus Margulisiibacteriota bacterium]